MLQEILEYCQKNNVKCIFLDFFGTIVQRNCSPQEIKYFWAKRLAEALEFHVDERELIQLRLKSEQAVIARTINSEFQYCDMVSELYSRIAVIHQNFSDWITEEEFVSISHDEEMKIELVSQNYIDETIQLIKEARAKEIEIDIISDFYLGKDDLAIFLQKKDLGREISHIFVSCDHKTSKHNGGLYKTALKKVEVDSDLCIMVGDNANSDVKMAEKYGIRGFLLKSTEGVAQKTSIEERLISISKNNITGALKYSNYCYLLYLYSERLYKTLVREEIEDIYFLSREGQFLKKIFDFYLEKKNGKKIHTHYLYVSRKATYPATLKALKEETFDQLRIYPEFSFLDFFENIGMPEALPILGIKQEEAENTVRNFFESDAFLELCGREDFQKIYEESRLRYKRHFVDYCKQEGLLEDKRIVIADVGWNGTMQDNIITATGIQKSFGIYIGLTNKAKCSEEHCKQGIIFFETPCDSQDCAIWRYDHTFLERILTANHGATDHYQEKHGKIEPVLKNYTGENTNFELMSPVQEEILHKIKEINSILSPSVFSAELLYQIFLNIHVKMQFIINNGQLKLQKQMISGQMQNFGRMTTASTSIGSTFSRKNIIKKAWKRIRVIKNTEIMFRILLNYDQKLAIKILYRLHYRKISNNRKRVLHENSNCNIC